MSLLLDVALYLREFGSQLDFTSVQKVILYTLAARIGTNQITWINQTELAKEVGLKKRQFIYALKLLTELNLIKLIKKGRKNYYAMPLGKVQSSAPIDYEALIEQVHPSKRKVQSSAPYRCSVVHLSSPKNDKIHLNNQEVTIGAPLLKEKVKTKIKDKIKDIVHFDQFWNSYPRKESKKKAQEIWLKNNLDKSAQEIIEHVKNRMRLQWGSREMRFIPLAATFLNQERWNDELEIIGYENSRTFSQLNPQQAAYKRIMDNVWEVH